MKHNTNIILIISLCLFFFILGILVQRYIFNKASQIINPDINFYSHTTERKFTNPLLDCNANFTFINPSLEEIIKTEVSRFQEISSINKISVYFRMLNNGAWYGVNEKEYFIPASLNKVPLMIAAFKLSEEHPEILDQKFSFDDTRGTFQKAYISENMINKEKLFTLYEVIEYMIKYSDNETAEFLYEILNSYNKSFIDNVFNDLGIKAPNNTEIHQITTKDYASFFRVLYNSTYINNKNSERALLYLSETDFDDGLVKGIEDNIIISHKYGQISDSTLMQLHDCGIVYYPGNNYILCVMVKGYDIQYMAKTIQGISKAVYDEIKKQLSE